VAGIFLDIQLAKENPVEENPEAKMQLQRYRRAYSRCLRWNRVRHDVIRGDAEEDEQEMSGRVDAALDDTLRRSLPLCGALHGNHLGSKQQ